jgi:hypothetical protein
LAVPDRPSPDDGPGSEKSPQGGSERIPDSPPDLPGKGRGIALVLVAVLALLALALPVLWGLGAVVALQEIAPGAVTVFKWIVAGALLVALVLVVRGMWRRAA